MGGPCASYKIEGDAASGPCLHPAGYIANDDEYGDTDYCACHYGEPYDPAECRARHAFTWDSARARFDGLELKVADPKHRAPTEDEDLEDEAPAFWHRVGEGDGTGLPPLLIHPSAAPRSARSHTNHGKLGYEHTGFEAGAL